MSERDAFFADGVEAGRDPVSAARDPWTSGAAVFAAMLDAASGRSASSGPRPAATEDSAAWPGAVSAEVASLVALALFATAASGLRTWQGLAQAHGAHQLALLRPLLLAGTGGQTAAQAARLQADGSRAWLREVGDVCLREARRLQAELEALGEAVAQKIEPPDPLAPHRRRWRPKP